MSKNLELTDRFPDGKDRATKVNRSGSMVLDPLAKVGIGVLMSVCVRGGEFVMDILGYRERSQG